MRVFKYVVSRNWYDLPFPTRVERISPFLGADLLLWLTHLAMPQTHIRLCMLTPRPHFEIHLVRKGVLIGWDRGTNQPTHLILRKSF